MNDYKLWIIFGISLVCTCGTLATLWLLLAFTLAKRRDAAMRRVMDEMRAKKGLK